MRAYGDMSRDWYPDRIRENEQVQTGSSRTEANTKDTISTRAIWVSRNVGRALCTEARAGQELTNVLKQRGT